MKFDLVRYYDTCCDRCGNWASGEINPQEMHGNKINAEKTLIRYGWKVIDGETVCDKCFNDTHRPHLPYGDR
jgi:hypothetical protein